MFIYHIKLHHFCKEYVETQKSIYVTIDFGDDENARTMISGHQPTGNNIYVYFSYSYSTNFFINLFQNIYFSHEINQNKRHQISFIIVLFIEMLFSSECKKTGDNSIKCIIQIKKLNQNLIISWSTSHNTTTISIIPHPSIVIRKQQIRC